MLSNPELAKYTERLTWLFVSRNHKGDERDREAERTHDRFGVSCWPVLITFDPRDDAVLAEMPRGMDECRAVIDRLLAQKIPAAAPAGAPSAGSQPSAPATPTSQPLGDPDPRLRAIALEELVRRKLELDPAAEQRLDAMVADPREDIVVRIRAVRALHAGAPARLAPHTEALLALPNDVMRYAVLEHVAAHPNPKLARVLETLFRDIGGKLPSVNPNVVRIHVAKCLAGSGDAATVAALAPMARAANPRNGLSGVILKTLAALAERLPETRAPVAALLLESFPAAVGDRAAEAEARPALGLARTVRESLASASRQPALPALPAGWSRAEREAYLEQLRQAVGR